MSHRNDVVTAVLVLTGLALAVGCSSNSKGERTEEGTKTVESLRSVRQNIKQAPKEVDKVIASLNAMSGGGDLKTTYATYSKQVDALEASGERARKRSQAMRSNADQYIARWEEEANQFQSPELREGMQQRRESVRENFTKIRTAAQSAREAYTPFLRNLQEIERALANDLTPAAVRTIQPAIDKSKADGEVLKQRLAALDAELDRVAGEMSTAGTRPTAAK